MKTKSKQIAIIGTLTKYRNMFLRHLGYVGSSLPVTGEISKVPWIQLGLNWLDWSSFEQVLQVDFCFSKIRHNIPYIFNYTAYSILIVLCRCRRRSSTLQCYHADVRVLKLKNVQKILTVNKGLGSTNKSSLWSKVPHLYANSAPLLFHVSKYTVAHITLNTENRTYATSSTAWFLPMMPTWNRNPIIIYFYLSLNTKAFRCLRIIQFIYNIYQFIFNPNLLVIK